MAPRSRSSAVPFSAPCHASWCPRSTSTDVQDTNDADNRAALAAAPPNALDFVGIGVHGLRKPSTRR